MFAGVEDPDQGLKGVLKLCKRSRVQGKEARLSRMG
jgi:hypothetical protein